MRIFAVSLTVLVNLAVSSTLLQHIEIMGIKPNMSVLIIVSYAILRGDIEGAIVGFFSGLLHDIYFGNVIGVHALLGFVLGFICGKPFKNFFHDNDFLPLILVGTGTILYEFCYYFLTYLFSANIDLAFYAQRIILPTTIYTIAFTIPVYRLVMLINKWLSNREKEKRKLF